MAFNQASFFLYPPKYGPKVELDHSSKHVSGKSVEIVSSALMDASASEVLVDSVRRWFLKKRFQEKECYGGLQVLFRGLQSTPLGTQELIDVGLPVDEDEIRELDIRFLLTEHTPSEIAGWNDLITELGHDFGFRLMGPDHQLLPCIDFISVLVENRNFRSFQESYGWKV